MCCWDRTVQCSVSAFEVSTSYTALPNLCFAGTDALGYIACTGTNFCLRCYPLADCGWFPTFTITEVRNINHL
jgi:hypothetical protein